MSAPNIEKELRSETKQFRQQARKAEREASQQLVEDVQDARRFIRLTSGFHAIMAFIILLGALAVAWFFNVLYSAWFAWSLGFWHFLS